MAELGLSFGNVAALYDRVRPSYLPEALDRAQEDRELVTAQAGDGVLGADGAAEHIGDGDALPRARIEMLDKPHVDIAGEQGELDRAKFVKGPALPAASCGDSFVPHCRHFFAQRPVLDLL